MPDNFITAQDRFLPVQFRGDTVVLVDHENQPYVAMKPVVENLGLAWQSQHVKLAEKFGAVITIIVTTGGDGKQYEMVCLPLRKLPAFLYSVNPSKVAPELRDKIVAYQEECDDALWQYWTTGAASRQGQSMSVTQRLAAQRHSLHLVKALKAEPNPQIKAMVHAQLLQVCQMLGMPAPTLAQLSISAIGDADADALAQFWDAYRKIGAALLNHSRDSTRIALNLNQIEQLAGERKLRLPPRDRLQRALRECQDPKFVDVRSVNSRINADTNAAALPGIEPLSATVKCWVFAVEGA
ncbi:phage antirepressor N-terminal domain-containing protein [Chitiniphilus eburneus]|uniref:phage antirepressor N-terminal domain-containing protein n=1 Tax=Chitiniphilus eburneus TaxID=2571148 RepID=UPI0035CFE293